jgi:monofunctional biosynthetic peptidoglycan transglycosylase
VKRLIFAPLVISILFVGTLLWLDSPARGKVPPPEKLRTWNPKTTALIEIRKAEGQLKKRPYAPALVWTPLQRISPNLQSAVLAAEDDRFYQHHGVEWDLVQEAFKDNWRAGKPVRGASTITQQLAKNLYLTPRKTYVRKARELFYTWRLERSLPKRRILEIYLNVAEWGDGIFGAEAASRAYFGKSAAELSMDEAVALATVLPSPRRHRPGDGTKWTSWRTEWVWNQLRFTGRLPSARAPSAANWEKS